MRRLPVERAGALPIRQTEHDVVDRALQGAIFGRHELQGRVTRGELRECRVPAILRRLSVVRIALVGLVARLAEYVERDVFRERLVDEVAARLEGVAAIDVQHREYGRID